MNYEDIKNYVVYKYWIMQTVSEVQNNKQRITGGYVGHHTLQSSCGGRIIFIYAVVRRFVYWHYHDSVTTLTIYLFVDCISVL